MMMKKVFLLVLTQVFCVIAEVGTVFLAPLGAVFIARLSILIWILLTVSAIVIIYFAYNRRLVRNGFFHRIAVVGVLSLIIWTIVARLVLDAFGMYGSSMEDSIARGIVLYIFVPILSLWSTGWWAFFKLWPFNKEKLVR